MKCFPRNVLLLLLFAFASDVRAENEKPNFVLIMCDDLGWGDVGFNGATHIRTPHLDEMAANGLNLTHQF